MEEVPRRTLLAPLMSPRSSFFIGVEREGLLDYQGRAGVISIVRWNLRQVIFGLRFPRPQKGTRIPISWKCGFRGPKTPSSPRSVSGSFRQKKKNPLFFCKGTHGEWGFLDRKPPFPAFFKGDRGVFGPQNPLFQEMGIRAPFWGRGNRHIWCRKVPSKVPALFSLLLHQVSTSARLRI